MNEDDYSAVMFLTSVIMAGWAGWTTGSLVKLLGAGLLGIPTGMVICVLLVFVEVGLQAWKEARRA